MSFSNVVGGKLKLKGTALDVRAGGMKKKKKRQREAQEQQQQQQLLLSNGQEEADREGNNSDTRSSEAGAGSTQGDEGDERQQAREDQRTPAEKRYHEQKARLEARRLAKVASKSHRQRVEEFNQYLANLSEHYDIPKVGPG